MSQYQFSPRKQMEYYYYEKHTNYEKKCAKGFYPN